MKAVLCKEYGPAEKLVVEEVPTPSVDAHSVLIDVKAAGINFPDTLIIENKYQFKPPLPFIPGTEVAGVVAAVGEKVSHIKVGDKVMGFAFVGGYAQQMVVPGASCFPPPQQRALGCTWRTKQPAPPPCNSLFAEGREAPTITSVASL